MKKKLLLSSIALCCLLLAQLLSQNNTGTQSYQLLYDKAESLFNGTATDSTDSIALSYYTQIVAGLHPDISNALMLYNCFERSGILKQGLGYASEDMLHDYYSALAIHHAYHFSDSILFRLLLSAGNVHYAKGLFDSAVHYFSRAEKIISRYPAAGLAGDLYNSLGALYSEAGNYVQSGVYFSKALELTKQDHPELKEAIFAMSANVASAARLSGYPDSALLLYKKLLNAGQPSVTIVNNISRIFLTKKEPDSALYYLQTMKAINGPYAMAVYNAMAGAYMQKGDTAKASARLQIAFSLYKMNTAQTKNSYYAATQKYSGDLLMLENKPGAALPYYQQAIIQYDYKFNDSNVLANPGNFIGDFASYTLFDALAAKAACFAALYNGTKTRQYYKAALNTYDSAFVLADYIKKSIDNDEARLFIADKVFDAYNKAVAFLMNADGTRSEAALIHVLEWISKSRATSLAISLKENNIRQYAGLPDSLLQKEKNSKITISRLKLQLQQSRDTAEQTRLLSAINTASLQLQTINNTFKDFPDYYRQKFAADNINIHDIQKQVLNNETAAICYFRTGDKLYAFVIKTNAISVHEINNDTALERNSNSYITALAENNTGKTYDESAGKYLYSKLVQPLKDDIAGLKFLIIIPDQDLINIPFEAFEAEDSKYLVQDYAITYQYALPFLQKNKARFDQNKAIAFAPFAYNNSSATMSRLPSSIKEISGFQKSSQLIAGAATKRKFIAAAGNASVIHLATHAAVDYKEPENSYIAFYEGNTNDSSYKMYAHELYNLQLPHTQFVFLSACETGSGKVSQSEGALSLSRAFAFAGCPNIITSLWKAEDKSTAYLSEKFYRYVNKGYSYAQALQRAKKDLLGDETMSQFHAPAYWSHLIFIGDVQEQKSSVALWITAIVFTVIVILLIIYKSKVNKRRFAI